MSVQADVPCFLLLPTTRYLVSLRRWGGEGAAPCGYLPWGCDTSVDIGVEEHKTPPISGPPEPRYAHLATDPRWPERCSVCGAPFRAEDPKQVRFDVLYRRADTGEEMVLSKAPPGAMWDCPWLHHKVGPDGQSLTVRLPDGRDWWVDGPSKNGSGWTRTGTAPAISVNPSIQTEGNPNRPGYHGFLTNGVLRSCQ